MTVEEDVHAIREAVESFLAYLKANVDKWVIWMTPPKR